MALGYLSHTPALEALPRVLPISIDPAVTVTNRGAVTSMLTLGAQRMRG